MRPGFFRKLSVVSPADAPPPSQIADIHGHPEYTPVGAGPSDIVSGTDDEVPSNEERSEADATSGASFTVPELGMRP